MLQVKKFLVLNKDSMQRWTQFIEGQVALTNLINLYLQ